MAEAAKTVPEKEVAPVKEPTHIRFVGSTDNTEDASTVVFGKLFHRGKWVPLTNLDGSNPDKKALEPGQLDKLAKNPAFELGDGTDKAMPAGVAEDRPSEEA